jgi:hypothetical protein
MTVAPLASEPDAIRSRVIGLGLRVAAVAVGFQTMFYSIDLALPGSRRLLDADDDLSMFSWLAVAAAAVAAVVALCLAALLGDRRRTYYTLAAMLAFLSLDDMVQIHEGIALRARISGVEYSERFLWPLIYLPLLVGAFILLESIARSEPVTVRRTIRLGLALLTAAVMFEIASSAVLDEDLSTVEKALYLSEVTVEEAAELGGWIAVATALAAILASGLVRKGSAT